MARESNAEVFGDVIDEMLTALDIQMTIELPAGTQEAKIKGIGNTSVDLFIVLSALRTAFKELCKDHSPREPGSVETIIDDCMAMVKADVLEALKGGGD